MCYVMLIRYGQGEGAVWLDNVYCEGDEEELGYCEHDDWGVTDCDHREDAGVSCSKSTLDISPIFLNENIRFSIKISLKFVPKFPINSIPVLVQIMAWRRPGDKPLSEPMMVFLLTHICVTRPQWVKQLIFCGHYSGKYIETEEFS